MRVGSIRKGCALAGEKVDYHNMDTTRALLKRAYLRLCLERGASDVYPAQVAYTAGFSRRTFYRHFASIQAIRAEALEDALPYKICNLVELNKDTIPLEQASDRIIGFFQDHPLATAVFLGKEVDAAFEAKLIALLRQLFRALLERSFDLAEEDLELLVEMLAHARLSLIRLWGRRCCLQHGGSFPSLYEMNMLADNVLEKDFWVQIAVAAEEDKGKKRINREECMKYPWQQ